MLSRTLAFAICAQLASCHFNELRDMKACHGIYKLNSCHASLLPPLLFGRPPLQLGNFDGGHRAKRATCIKSNHNRQQIPSLSFCLSLCSLLFPLASRNVFYEATQKCNMHFVAVLLLTCAWYECTMKHCKDSQAYIHTHTDMPILVHTSADTRNTRARTLLLHLLHESPVNCQSAWQLNNTAPKSRQQKIVYSFPTLEKSIKNTT